MNNETLKALYYGNLRPAEQQMIRGSDAARVIKALSETEETLSQALPPELRPLLDRLTDARAEMNCITAREHYIDGFKTGARLVMEVLDDRRENLKPITG